MNEIEIYKCHLFVTLMMYYNSSKRKFEKKGKENIMEILRVEDLVKTYGKGENQVFLPYYVLYNSFNSFSRQFL